MPGAILRTTLVLLAALMLVGGVQSASTQPDLTVFRSYLDNLASAKMVRYRDWEKSNPGETARWNTYRDALLRGEDPAVPSMASAFGKMLIAVGQMAGPEASAPPPPPPPPADGANVWVDPNGGSCSRSTVGAYVDASACPSFAAAYSAAQSGDVIGVLGTLGAQFFAGGVGASQGSGSKVLTFRGAAGNKVRQIHFGSPGLTFDGIDVDASGTRTSGAAFENGGSPFVFRNGWIGNVVDEKGALVTNENGSAGGQIVFDSVVFHDVVLRTDGVHLECMMALSPAWMTIRNSRFENCAIMDASIGIADWWSPQPGPYGNVTLEGNFWGASTVDNGACCAVYGLALWATKVPVGNDFGQLNGWTIRNNVFDSRSDVIVRPTVGSGTVTCGNTETGSGSVPSSWKAPC